MSETVTNANILKLKEFLPYRLSVLSNRVSDGISSRYADQFNLTVAEWRTLAILGEQPEISASEVVQRTAMDKVAISRAVKSLLAAARIERHFSADDKRRSVLALSAVGMEIYSQIVPMALAYENELLNKLDQEERTFLNHILDKLTAIQKKSEVFSN